ncbi:MULTISPECIES: flagellar motor protein MotB [Marinomonas]|uniref:Motility protein B-like N-terminal domain-containing protein n=1 Tax=Marinomonas rhodophyticola TaxID=2992803 RepID=A0ABT3KLU5_9GAMM|nr:flagellar motor protein MotB [Marinomonas sp. KJ51-3]MCW4631527.1 hypothetical protein [Marinomonas sp. KJ51-3]
MALGSNGLVIRRVKKIKKGGRHSGAWKIALADFALAMMALFLVLWILSVASPEELASIEGYFQDPTGASTAGFSANPIDLGGVRQRVLRENWICNCLSQGVRM